MSTKFSSALIVTVCILAVGCSTVADVATDTPSELNNLQLTEENLVERLEAMEETGDMDDLSTASNMLRQIHADLVEYSEDPELRPHPIYSDVHDNYPDYKQRLHTLHQEHGDCTYGYTIGGEIKMLDVEWSPSELAEYQEQADDDRVRCWLDEEPTTWSRDVH